jgi:hypothetical protein
MKRNLIRCFFSGALCLFFGLVFCFRASADGLEFSGFLDSRLTSRIGAGESVFGVEEYANLRMQARIRDNAVFYGAVNLIAAAGSYVRAGSGVFSFAGENYAAGIEPERLYFRLNGNWADFEGGLMRLAFGYGQVFGPSDFLNPKNPLVPDARPSGILGGALSIYQGDLLRWKVFGAASGDPLTMSGGLTGFSLDQHWNVVSLQILYSCEISAKGSRSGVHRTGLSLKADFEVGFTADILYTVDSGKGPGIEGLAASGSLDYSFFRGKCLVLAEYLYNGADSSTSVYAGNQSGFSGEHYLYGSFTYMFNDYTSLTAASLVNFSDYSLQPVLIAEHELFQGFTLTFSARIPLDRDVFTRSGNRGELGPLPPGAGIAGRFIFTAGAKLRF